MASVGGWAKQQARLYFDNAGSKRDFRVQLRGSRAIVLWSAYLIVFCLIAGFAYQFVGSSGDSMSIVDAQNRLHGFYQGMLGLLGGLVTLIAPALGASAVVTERNRQALDLVFSAPVTTKYYLIGKLISAYRYIWLLMILSLPIVSVGAVMGGASWTDVLTSFLIISLDGLLFAAIGLAISAGASRLPATLVYSYAATFALAISMSVLSASAAAMSAFGRAPTEIPFTALLSPFTVSLVSASSSVVFGQTIPNWLLLLVVVLLVVRLLLYGGGSALATRHVRETTIFRVLVLVFVALLAYFSSDVFHSAFPTITRSPSSAMSSATSSGTAFAGYVMLYVLAIPMTACYVRFGVPKFQFDGPSNVRNIFTAKPSGALAYLLAIPLAGFIGFVSRGLIDGAGSDLFNAAAYLVWSMGLFAFFWSLCRLSSKIGGTLTASRAIGLAFIWVIQAIWSAMVTDPDGAMFPLSPLSVFHKAGDEAMAVLWGVLLCAMAVVVSFFVSHYRKDLWKPA